MQLPKHNQTSARDGFKIIFQQMSCCFFSVVRKDI
ncbi:unnamed protein product [Musa acuminata subsp. malaccensis]|uniref:(wild Malaysian banana) hypothetical protein n=1 Tax=Musa acuminata subsp. malaccensis TaxID=214687 RepID=A0A804L6L9_MUSAM|nr:unnamed protein product [Musa acuminata subsp. malaccensis]